MKGIKGLFLLVAFVLFVVIVGFAVFVMTFNPNDYKPRIEQLVKEKTGRTLVINGQMRLTFFPRLGLRLPAVSLSNPAGFSVKRPFARINQLDLDVEFLPLLRHQLIVDHVVLDGLELDLLRRSNGQTNWQDLTGSIARSTRKKVPMPGKPSATGMVAGAPFAFSVAGIEIHGAKIVYDDQLVGRQIVIAPLSMNVGHLSPGRSAPMTLNLHVQDSKPALALDMHLTAQLSADLATARYKLSNMSLKLLAKGRVVPQGAIDALIQSTLNVDLSKNGAISLKPFKVTINATHLTGDVAVTDFAHPNINCNLVVDRLDFDKYFPSTIKKAQTSASGTSGASSSSWSGKPLSIPFAELRRINAVGRLSIDQLIMRKIKLSQVQVDFGAQQGLINASRITANLYGGTFKGTATLDAHRATPSIELKAAINGLMIGDLLKDYMGDNYLSGKTKAQLDLHSRGDSERAIVNALGGNLSLAVRDGSIQHSDLANQIQSIVSKLQELRLGSAGGLSGGETQFASLTASGQVKNGVLDNHDLVLNAIRFMANGHGTVNLPKRNIDYTLVFTQANAKGTPIPLLIKGPLRHPGYEVDLKSMAQNILQKRLGLEKQQMGEKLKQQLQGLFK